MTKETHTSSTPSASRNQNGRLRLWREPASSTNGSTNDDLASHVGTLREEVASLQHALQDAKDTITYLEDRQQIDGLLAAANTIDIEASRLLTMVALSGMEDPDIEAAVNSLRDEKPYLFNSAASESNDVVGGDASETATPDASPDHRPRGPYPIRSIAMAPAIGPTSTQRMARSLADAANKAMVSGRRDDLLSYLRLRRSVATDGTASTVA